MDANFRMLAASASERFRSYECERVDILRSYTLHSLALATTNPENFTLLINMMKWLYNGAAAPS
jgi:hypothetical protein